MDDLKVVNQFINDFWKLIKTTYDQPTGEAENNKYWQDLFERAHVVAREYGEHTLAKYLLMAYLDYQESVFKGRKELQ